MVDYEEFARPLGGFKFQPKLFLQGCREWRCGRFAIVLALSAHAMRPSEVSQAAAGPFTARVRGLAALSLSRRSFGRRIV